MRNLKATAFGRMTDRDACWVCMQWIYPPADRSHPFSHDEIKEEVMRVLNEDGIFDFTFGPLELIYFKRFEDALTAYWRYSAE